MNFDKILDFLFHRILGVAVLITTLLLLMLCLSGCLSNDLLACFWQGTGCDDCSEFCQECSEMENSIPYALFGGPGSCALNDCLYGPDGCTSECGGCYTHCGGVNYSCFRAVCFEDGCGKGCYEVDGYQRATCLNCITYCSGIEDPGSPNYQKVFLFRLRIVYNYDGEEYVDEFELYENSTHIPVDSSSYNGKTFKGFYSKPGGQGTRFTDEDGKIIATPSAGSIAYAYYADRYEGIEFKLNIYEKNEIDGEYILTQTIKIQSGESLEDKLPDPDAFSGYEFCGWKIRSNDTMTGDQNGFFSKYKIFYPENYGFSSNGKTEGDLFAMYCPETFDITVNYSPVDLNQNPKRISLDYGASVWESLGEPKIFDGYQFVGYALDRDATQMVPEDAILTGDMEIYAVYKPEIIVNFDESDIAEREYTYSKTYYLGQLVTLPVPEYIPDGMQYIGWSPSNNYSNVSMEVVIDSTYDDITLKPHFKVAEYTIEYRDADGTFLRNDGYTQGENKLLMVQGKDHYTFNGWRDQNGKLHVGTLAANVQGDLVLTADYTPEKYTISLQPMNGATLPSVSVSYGDSFHLTVPTRSGYDFQGWYYNNGYQDILVTDASGNSNRVFEKFAGSQQTDSNLNITLNAKWVKTQYTVTFMANGQQVSQVVVSHQDPMPTPPTAPDKTGHEFDRWTISGNTVDFSSTVTSNLTVEAQYTPKTYTIVFRLTDSGAHFAGNSQTEISVQYVYGSSTINASSISAQRPGYTLIGWYSAPEGAGTFCLSANWALQPGFLEYLAGHTGDCILYAAWIEA